MARLIPSFTATGMLQDIYNVPPGSRPYKPAPYAPADPAGRLETLPEPFHVTHKIPVGDTPYVRAKHVQLVEKDPEKAIPLFWAAINAGDRVDSALKDMAIVMKQQNRSEEAIEAIKSLRSRCSDQSQESLDNILLELYKRCGRLEDQIGLLRYKLLQIHQGVAFNGKRTKTARSQGRKFQVSADQEATRLLGNLGWALMQQNSYAEAEDAYRRALVITADSNKMCNLGICLMKQGRIAEAKETLRRVKPAAADGARGGGDSHLKAYERAQQMLSDLETAMMMNVGSDHMEKRRLFEAFLGSSPIWQPQPCREQKFIPNLPPRVPLKKPSKLQNDENLGCNNILAEKGQPGPVKQMGNHGLNMDPQSNNSDSLKRTRSGNAATSSVSKACPDSEKKTTMALAGKCIEEGGEWLLPDSGSFEEAIMAVVLGPEQGMEKRKQRKRLKVFQDITLSSSPGA